MCESVLAGGNLVYALHMVVLLDCHLDQGGENRFYFGEREIYIFPWLQVRITGPRHHLTSSLRSYAQGYDKTRRYLKYVFEYGLLGYAAWFSM